ncbi:hypothetical protein [Chryseobacterium sp. CFBP8996]|uniref:hypothetical protein n=1 Tax=Chryseobacterium sp. CFBP8996 TaxID=3096529 RepID=UPI002A6AD4AA|nr:hypothetical protein [Chryseobacterium sp. CFBP8996]MDY0932269.1 hypothetical protein [Chryseobacterium sp. CFBP8996]
MYTEIDQETLDIDWFFTDGENIGFVTSGGGELPKSIAEKNKKLVSYFRNLPDMSDTVINPNLDSLLNEIFGNGVDERYLEDYLVMTRKGLYSFDKTYLNNFRDSNYHLVAASSTPLILEDLPQDIFEILIETKYSEGYLNNISVIDVGKIL